MRSVHKVGILIVRNVPRVASLIVRMISDHLHLLPGGDFDQCPRGGEFEFFLKMKMSKSPPHARSFLPRA